MFQTVVLQVGNQIGMWTAGLFFGVYDGWWAGSCLLKVFPDREWVTLQRKF